MTSSSSVYFLPIAGAWAALLLSQAAAQGDYACQTTADCAAWSYPNATGGPFPVSANMECVADPLQPEYGFCGYAGAKCEESEDCDYGSCTDGVCVGYLGYGCSSDHDCMGFLHCGSDNFCGGQDAVCAGGDVDCMSSSCSTQSRCSAPDEEGQADGLACSSDHNCQEGSTCVDYICQAASQSSASHSPQPSASSAPRSGSSHGAPYKRHAMLNHVELARAIVGSKSKRASTSCPSGYTLCPSGTGDGDSDFGYECVDTNTSVSSCGGCLPMPGYDGETDGVDCTVLDNVDQVRCAQGTCVIDSCLPGTVLNPTGTGCF